MQVQGSGTASTSLRLPSSQAVFSAELQQLVEAKATVDELKARMTSVIPPDVKRSFLNMNIAAFVILTAVVRFVKEDAKSMQAMYIVAVRLESMQQAECKKSIQVYPMAVDCVRKFLAYNPPHSDTLSPSQVLAQRKQYINDYVASFQVRYECRYVALNG